MLKQPFHIAELIARYLTETLTEQEKYKLEEWIFPDITTFNDGRIIAINVDNKENREKKLGRGILIENNKISVIGDSGMLKKQLPL